MKYDFEAMGIDRKALVKAVNGDMDGLMRSFIWDDTPQGYIYWYNQYDGARPFDTDTLRDMLEQYDEWVKE